MPFDLLGILSTGIVITRFTDILEKFFLIELKASFIFASLFQKESVCNVEFAGIAVREKDRGVALLVVRLVARLLVLLESEGICRKGRVTKPEISATRFI